jgi:sn-glycerol 3-phosphate transport system substrate-binding protein
MKNLLFLVILCAAGAAGAAEEIRLWHGMSGALGTELDRLVARYNASQKQYRVVSFFQGPYDEVMADEINVRRGTRRAPHLVQVTESGTADMLKSGAVRPIWELVQLDAKYLPAVSAQLSDAEGRLYALPFTGATPVLYYNRDSFRDARLDPGKVPHSWADMPETLAALAESGQGCALTSAWPSWVLVENMSAWHNQRFVSQGRLAFNTRLMVRWVATLASWHKAGYYTHSGRGDEAEARFAAGECAILISSSAAYARLRKAARFDVGVAQLPYYDDFDDAPQNTLVGGSALWAIAGGSPAANRGVASFLEYLARVEVQTEWLQRTGDVPLTTAADELARKHGFHRRNPAHDIAVRQLLSRPTEDSAGVRLGGLRMIRGIIDEELESVWSGAKTPLDALNSAVQRGNLLLETAR